MDPYALPLATKPNGLRIIVCGGRDYFNQEAVYRALDLAHHRKRIGVIVHGGAPGVDSLAQEWAEFKRVPHEPHLAEWKTLGKAAGPMRNMQMVSLGADGCIAFPGGAGTADCAARCVAAGIPVWRPFG